MRADLRRRLERLERRLDPPDVPPFLVYGDNEDGQVYLLWASWRAGGVCKSWDRHSGTAPPAELTALIKKYHGDELNSVGAVIGSRRLDDA